MSAFGRKGPPRRRDGARGQPIAQIAHTVSKIAICDREVGRLNATSTSRFDYIHPVLSGAAPAVAALFQEGVVWDAFNAVAGLPVVSGGAGAKDKLKVRNDQGPERLWLSGPTTVRPERRRWTARRAVSLA